MFSSARLKEIVSEARPYIERQMDDADMISGFRDVVAAEGGDWSALKALIKAQIKDERDETGKGSHVQKILDKAEFSSGYADMLGWSNMNEQNFSSEPQVAPQPAQSLPVQDDPVVTPSTGQGGDESPVNNSPETANETPSTDTRVEGRGVHTVHPLQDQSEITPSTVVQFNRDETTEERCLRLRPHCLNPSACAGVGKNHCFGCRKAVTSMTGESA
ncbi:hypothetical protein OF122_13100 [Pelagibacterium flavum]|uniref:Uncharacterized protein n=1 Tax=Pelagibacterium flavum TaxID=2984530 RepID=A0ABY6IK67_9HYPH|nr:hypothetical protein [Pelagibacterium sp. YIM 151497]UYQ70996.1 hypothetical protein OF122_13100 [Pelagibacterium sp. YIM 151497]